MVSTQSQRMSNVFASDRSERSDHMENSLKVKLCRFQVFEMAVWKIMHFGLGNDQDFGILKSVPDKFRGGF